MGTPESGEKPPAKRPESSDQVPNTEQPEAKRLKLGDPQPKELGDDIGMLGEYHLSFFLCAAFGFLYSKVLCKSENMNVQSAPTSQRDMEYCKSSNDEHKGRQTECIKFCEICGSQAKHWSDDCPYEDDKYFGTMTPRDDDDGFF